MSDHWQTEPPPGELSVAVLAFAALPRGWPSQFPDHRAAYSRQVPAMLVDWLDLGSEMFANLAVFTTPLPHSQGAHAWVQPERLLDPDELLGEVEELPDADVIVDGEISRQGERLRISVRVSLAEGAMVLDTFAETCDLRAVIPATARLARRIADLLGRDLEPIDLPQSHVAADSHAVTLFLLARDLELARDSGVEPGTGMSAAGLLGGAVALAPRFAPAVELLLAWVARALADDEGERAERVLLGLERATANVDADPRLWTARGLLAARRATDAEHAVALINEALDHGGDSVPLRIEVSERLIELERPREARRHLLRAAEDCPDDPTLIDRVAVLLGNVGALEQAVDLWRRGAELAPWDGTFFAQLGRAAQERGAVDQAWAYYAGALRAADLPHHTFRYLAGLASEHPAPPAVVEQIEALSLTDDVPALGWAELGDLCLVVGLRARAIEVLERGLARASGEALMTRIRRSLLEARSPGSGASIEEAARTLLERDPRLAIRSIDAALSVESGFWPAWHLKGVALRRLGDWEEAAEAFEMAVELAPAQAAPVRGLGQVQLRLGRTVEAVETLRRAVVLDPRDARIRVMLASALLVAGRDAEARDELEGALRLDPGLRGARSLRRRLRLAGLLRRLRAWPRKVDGRSKK